eukprot:m.3139 g.3139  ORF g.3139 m.3139 type:complete len:240 (-) comp2020_c0_seq1:289-1008(-)
MSEFPLSVPTGLVGRVIGKAGENVKRLKVTYGVTIYVEKNSKSPESAITISGRDPQGCIDDIMNMLDSANPNPRPGPHPNGGGVTKEFFVFQLNSNTNELQLLLQKRDTWTIPSTTEPDHLGYLQAVLGGENPPMENLLIEMIANPKGKEIYLVVVPPAWENWIPSPTQDGMHLVDTSAEGLEIYENHFEARGGHMWVDLLCAIGVQHELPKSVPNFLKHNMKHIVNASYYLRAQKNGH